MRTRAPAVIEALESRELLSAANIVGDFSGTVSHGKSSFVVTLDVNTEDRHGVVVGTIAIRFSKHDAPVYSYAGRVVGDTLTIDIPTHNTSINGTVNTRKGTITGTGTAEGGSGVFSLKELVG